MKTVAMLIPVYNDQEGLEKSCSTLPSEVGLDVVIVDDGSDPPIRLPSMPSVHRPILLRLERNKGVPKALNCGLRWILERDYEFVARLDAGDVSLPRRIWNQVEFLHAHPDYAIIGGQARFVDDNGIEVFQDRFPTHDKDIRRMMHVRNCFVHPGVMIRISAIRDVGLYNPLYHTAQDFELFFRIMNRYKVANLPDYIVDDHVNMKGISFKNRRNQVINRLKVMLRNYDIMLPESTLGLIKNIILLVMPVALIQGIKRALGDRRNGWL